MGIVRIPHKARIVDAQVYVLGRIASMRIGCALFEVGCVMKQATEITLEKSEQFMLNECGFDNDNSAAQIEHDQQESGGSSEYVSCERTEELPF